MILGADFVIAAGGYPAREVLRAAGQHVPTIEIPPESTQRGLLLWMEIVEVNAASVSA